MNIESIISENKKRIADLNAPYDPFLGIGSPIERKPLIVEDLGEFNMPVNFFASDFGILLQEYGSLGRFLENEKWLGNIDNVTRLFIESRCDFDFEFFAAYALKIEDKETAEITAFNLRRAQRRLLSVLESMRLAGVPIRVVLVKARQWGGSTLVQMYMFWIQQRLKKNWHISVCAQDDNAAKNVRKMYERASKEYPSVLGSVTLQSYAKSPKNLQCLETGGVLGVGSINNPDQFRSYSNKMIHMTELCAWQDTPKRTGKMLASSLKNAIADVPYSVVVEESTARGVGNYFHEEWLAAEQGIYGTKVGKSRYYPVFVPWFEIEMYENKIDDYVGFINSMGAYDKYLWELGATLENIAWYRAYKGGENKTDLEMFEEYPSTANEAFVSSGLRVYPHDLVLNARKTVTDPIRICTVEAKSRVGESALEDIKLIDTSKGNLKIWSEPQSIVEIGDKKYRVTNRYALFGDIGGTHKLSDPSALAVMDRFYMIEGGLPEIAAIWHGHLGAVQLAWLFAQVAKLYDNGLLAFESNSADKEKNKEGDHFLTAINQLAGIYDNLYVRNKHDSLSQSFEPKYGFHTNTATKTMIIDRHKFALEKSEYVERHKETCNEMDYYENTKEGKMEAQKGKHDDLVIVTAGVTWMALEYMPPPKLVEIVPESLRKGNSVGIVSEASF
jgi:hypothetical protein